MERKGVFMNVAQKDDDLVRRRPLNKILAACGNDCSACPRYVAHPYEKTDEALRHTSELWMKIGYRDSVVSNEEISCMGCRPESLCRYHVVTCCMDRGIKNCSQCDLYPCGRMKECFEITRSFESRCHDVCTEEEYRLLKKAFFEKEQNLEKHMTHVQNEEANHATSKRQSAS